MEKKFDFMSEMEQKMLVSVAGASLMTWESMPDEAKAKYNNDVFTFTGHMVLRSAKEIMDNEED